MTDKPGPEARQAKAERFRLFLEREGINGDLEAMRRQYVDAMIATKPGDDAGRYRLWQVIQILDSFRNHLELVVKDGEIAERELRRLKDGKRGFF